PPTATASRRPPTLQLPCLFCICRDQIAQRRRHAQPFPPITGEAQRTTTPDKEIENNLEKITPLDQRQVGFCQNFWWHSGNLIQGRVLHRHKAHGLEAVKALRPTPEFPNKKHPRELYGSSGIIKGTWIVTPIMGKHVLEIASLIGKRSRKLVKREHGV